MDQPNQQIERFKTKARSVHGDKYDYSLWTEYIPSASSYHKKNIPVICPLHGEFATSVANHLRGTGCPTCAKEKRASQKRKDKNFFIHKARKVHKDKYDYSLWKSVANTSRDKVTIICPEHGEFVQTPADHINSAAGCPRCSKEARRKTCNLKYGTEHPAQKHIPPETLDKLDDKEWLEHQHHTIKRSIPEIANLLKVSDSVVATRFNKHNLKVNRYHSSEGEKQLIAFLEKQGVDLILNDRKILGGRELDIVIPQYNIAIEYNGLYWHSERAGKHHLYHLDKTNRCEMAGYRLIHIFSDEWETKQTLCKDTLRHFLGKSERGVYGRQTTIKEIPWSVAKPFLQKHHLLGAGHTGNYRIGAFDKNNNLVAVMVFGPANNEHSDPNCVELRRFVTNKRNNPGVGSKMFSWACNQRGYNRVIAFVDRRWFSGTVKDHIGFKCQYFTPPAVWWTDGRRRFHRRFTTKDWLMKNHGFDAAMTKREMLEHLGLYRIWDCGKIKLLWEAI